MQAFCDSNLRFVMISSKLCSSTNDNTSYIVTQMSKDIKARMLPKQYHVVLDEAYPCTEQEMSPWKGRNLPVDKDAFNYYLSLNRQVIERAFGVLLQRWGIFWRLLKMSMCKGLNLKQTMQLGMKELVYATLLMEWQLDVATDLI